MIASDEFDAGVAPDPATTAPIPNQGARDDTPGPELARSAPQRPGRLTSALSGVVLMAAGLTVFNQGVGWVLLWWAWSGLIGFGALGYASAACGACAAGAEWFTHGTQRVRQYELTSVRVHARHLRLVDRDGGRVGVLLDDVQQDQRLWQLVHDGIVHSARSGAATNRAARHVLGLRRTTPGPQCSDTVDSDVTAWRRPNSPQR